MYVFRLVTIQQPFRNSMESWDETTVLPFDYLKWLIAYKFIYCYKHITCMTSIHGNLTPFLTNLAFIPSFILVIIWNGSHQSFICPQIKLVETTHRKGLSFCENSSRGSISESLASSVNGDLWESSWQKGRCWLIGWDIAGLDSVLICTV